jgi:ubiquinone biosynthesis protein UbiJ
MLLSVPIMVIINIILAKIPSTRPIAILLSEKWELQIEGDVEVEKTRKKLVDKVRWRFKKK